MIPVNSLLGHECLVDGLQNLFQKYENGYHTIQLYQVFLNERVLRKCRSCGSMEGRYFVYII